MLNAIIAFSIYAVLEKVSTGYEWPKEPYWVIRGVFWLVVVVGLNHVLGMVLHPIVYPGAMVDLSFMGLWGVIPSVLLLEVFFYALHRAQHTIPILWRIHQWHHSSERIDIWSTYRAHPLELPFFIVIGICTSAGVLGVTPQAAMCTNILLLGLQVIQHTNIRTPEWLGYFIVRPENHMLHHARNVHRSNYSDLPLVDMIFGTFEMQRGVPREVGFWNGASLEYKRYLICDDVAADHAETESLS